MAALDFTDYLYPQAWDDLSNEDFISMVVQAKNAATRELLLADRFMDYIDDMEAYVQEILTRTD